MLRKREPTVLYFTQSTTPTPEDEAVIEEIGGNIKLRNASMWSLKDNLEECAAVAGHPPEPYTERYPFVTSAAELREVLHPSSVGSTEEAPVAETEEVVSETPPTRRGRKPAKAAKAAAKPKPASKPTWGKV